MSYQRKQGDKKRYKKLSKVSPNAYPQPVWESNKPNRSNYYVRYWKSKGKTSCWTWNKKESHRTARRKYKDLDNKTSYNKLFDLWWKVY